MAKVINISQENYDRLTRLAGTIQASEGGDKTPNDAINFLFKNQKEA